MSNVKNAIKSISKGDVRGLRKNIQEALVEKVRKALTNKEKQIAKSLIEAATKTSLPEAALSADVVKKKMSELKALHASLDGLFFSGDKVAYGKALKKAVALGDELVAAGINPNTGGKKF